jgi:hypothetical protein
VYTRYKYEISIPEYEKRGEGINAYYVFKIITKVCKIAELNPFKLYFPFSPATYLRIKQKRMKFGVDSVTFSVFMRSWPKNI